MIELVSKWEILLGFVELIVFDPKYDPTRNNIVMVFNERFYED